MTTDRTDAIDGIERIDRTDARVVSCGGAS